MYACGAGEQMEGMSFFEKMKLAGKSLVDSGAKTMLKTDIVFLEREIKARKQKFGVEVYELMEQLELDTGMNTDEKETKISLAFDQARKDIAVISAKIECKREEMAVLEEEQKRSASKMYDIPPSSGVVLQDGHAD